jgi:hypothetical protein
MKNRVGGVPSLWDFYRFESVDPVLLATKDDHYPALVKRILKVESGLTEMESRALFLLSHEVLAGKRLHEFVLLDLLLDRESVSREDIANAFAEAELPAGAVDVRSSIDTLALLGYPSTAEVRYGTAIAQLDGESLRLSPGFRQAYKSLGPFSRAVDDLRTTGRQLVTRRYSQESPFTVGMQYTRPDAAHILGWPRKTASTIYGVKTDRALGVCAIFVTLEKSDGVAASTAYGDQLLDPSTMRWFTVSRRTLASRDVAPIVEGQVALHVFVKKDDADRRDHYYLGQATAHDASQTTMPGTHGEPLPVVSMLLRFDQAIPQGLFDYFSPLMRAK